MKCRTKSPVPLLNIPVEADDRPRVWITEHIITVILSNTNFTCNIYITALRNKPLLQLRWPPQSSRAAERTLEPWSGCELGAALLSHSLHRVHHSDLENLRCQMDKDRLNDCNVDEFKGIVHLKMKITPWLTHPQAILVYYFFSFRQILSELYKKSPGSSML